MSRYSKMIRSLKKDYAYTSKQLQRDFGYCNKTIRRWIKDEEVELKIISERPLMIFSEDLRNWLREKELRRKIKVGATQICCLPCKAAQTPLESKVAYIQLPKTTRLTGVCPDCYRLINKIQSNKKLAIIKPLFKTTTLEEVHILARTTYHENVHLNSTSKNGLSGLGNDTSQYEQQMLI